MRYIALTLGPITRVISLAQTTRGMWAASYLFSYLAKHIIEPFKDRTFLLPYLDSDMLTAQFGGAGVFPDRYIFEAEEDDFDNLSTRIKNVIEDLAKKIAPNDVDCANTMLMQYLKFYFFNTEKRIIDEGDAQRDETDRELVERCENQLALLEQHESFIPSIPENKHYLSRLINCERLAPMQFLLEDANIGQFKSIVNITSGDDGYGKEIVPQTPYQRYIAIVYADGDSMGKAFAKAENSKVLSNKLLQFNKKAIESINDFEGQPVYIRGDDLFFFTPIYKPGKGSIFTLLNTLDNNFHDAIGKDSPATLSFGVSITYYKYPMSEAVQNSQLLLNKAKNYGDNLLDNPLKNNVLFSVQKHSGQTRFALMHKGCTKTMEKTNKFIDTYIVTDNNDDLLLVTSAMHNLREHEPVLLNAISDINLLKNYFDNNYNEPVHGAYENFFNDVRDLLHIAYQEYSGKTDRLKNSLESPIEGRLAGHDAAYAAIDLCYSALQFIHLVNKK